MKQMVFFLVLSILLCGCKEKEIVPEHRVVTGVEVEYQQGERILHRSYYKTENVQAVLNYLRILRPFGPVIPEESDGDSCQITVHFSDGPDTVYMQQGNAYLCCNDGDWESIDSSRATLLYPMLLLMPSDT